LALKETNISQANAIAMICLAVASEQCKIEGASFHSELAARAFCTANHICKVPTSVIDTVALLHAAYNEIIVTTSII
jgi:hypothetical protein